MVILSQLCLRALFAFFQLLKYCQLYQCKCTEKRQLPFVGSISPLPHRVAPRVCETVASACDILSATVIVAALGAATNIGFCTVHVKFGNPEAASASSLQDFLEVFGNPRVSGTLPLALFSGGGVTVRGINFLAPCTIVLHVNSTLQVAFAASHVLHSSMFAIIPAFTNGQSLVYSRVAVNCSDKQVLSIIACSIVQWNID